MKHSCSQIAAILMLLASTASISAAERKTLHTGVPEVAAQLPRLERLPGTSRLRLAVGLGWRNQARLNNLFRQLYNPASVNFHRFLTPEQFTEQFGPTEEDYQNVISFAKANRLEVVGKFDNRAVLDLSGNVSDIEAAFHVTLGLYQHPAEDRRFFAPDIEPSVDGGVPINYVSGLDNYFIARPSSLKRYPPLNPLGNGPKPQLFNGSGTNGFYLGTDFRNAYVPGVSNTGVGQVVGLVELGGYTPSDIAEYEKLAGYSAVPLVNLLVDGTSNIPRGNDDEVSLDIEMVIAMAPGLNQVNIYEATNGNYTDLLNEIVSPTQGETRPKQISCSFGIGGDTNLQQQLTEMAMLGESFFYASGDGGAPKGGTNSSPQDDNYMTSVGGTELSMNGVGVSWQAEQVWNDQYILGSSYGAVVTSEPIPAYQRGIDMSLNQGSTVFRNIPDVAMVADYIEVVLTDVFTNGNPSKPGDVTRLGGTSAAAPLWAGFTALVNQQAESEGKPSVGFLNPALYEIGQGPLYTSCFHDITVGNSTNANNPTQYFAAQGYDLCTGWGTPVGANLIKALVGLTGPIFVDFNYTGTKVDGTYYAPYKTLAEGTNAVTPGGTIFIKTAGSSSETMEITKRMTITASDGSASIGD